jgi:multidrug efflux pump subunit AcrB
MSFEMKYDRDRTPKENTELKELAIQEHPEQPQEPVQEASEVEQAEEVTVPAPVQEDEVKKEVVVQASFRELRLKAERAERERDELLRMLKERELQQAPKTPEPVEDNEVTIGNDDLVEGKHLSKVGRQIKNLKEELNQYKQQSTVVAAENKLRSTYPDFDTIVSRDNIEALRIEFPEIANTINSSTGDLYSKAVSAYTMIKKLGIYKEPEVYSEEKEKVKANAVKPRPLASVSPLKGDSALSHANAFAKGLTKELQEQLRKEMDEARRQM